MKFHYRQRVKEALSFLSPHLTFAFFPIKKEPSTLWAFCILIFLAYKFLFLGGFFSVPHKNMLFNSAGRYAGDKPL